MDLAELPTHREICDREMAASRYVRWMVRLTWLPNTVSIWGLRLRVALEGRGWLTPRAEPQ
jgi:hypothetical protein